MLKTRVIGVLTVKNNRVVQSIGFNKYLPVGSLNVSVEYLNNWGIDEIVILDLDADQRGTPSFSTIKSASIYSQTPVSVGGGIRTLSDIETMIKQGADKVVINSEFLRNPDFLKEATSNFGDQCIIASIDVTKNSDSTYSVYSKNNAVPNKDLHYHLKLAEENGAGEILINSVDKDGTKTGYDLELLNYVKSLVSIPVIICGGVGKTSHLIEGVKAGADAVAAGNFFHFTELSVIASKQKMIQEGLGVRLDSYATFKNFSFDSESDRPLRLSDESYEKNRFDYVPQEVI